MTIGTSVWADIVIAGDVAARFCDQTGRFYLGGNRAPPVDDTAVLSEAERFVGRFVVASEYGDCNGNGRRCQETSDDRLRPGA